MPTDYATIAAEHRLDYGRKDTHLRIYKRLYAEKTHFLYELVQNAEDSRSTELDLWLRDGELLVWNNGRRFNQPDRGRKRDDVKAICSIGLSEKDLTEVGTFGIGFKAVYAYTDAPEIYSGEERFRIRRFVEPEGIPAVPAHVETLLREGRTVFRLPFKPGLQERDLEQLRTALRTLDPLFLLFLRHLEVVRWRDAEDGASGMYRRFATGTEIVDARRVRLEQEAGDKESSPVEFLVFRKERLIPPAEVIECLREEAEDDFERERVDRSAKSEQAVEVAFALDGDALVPSVGAPVFSFLPTGATSGLRFRLQARYQTTPARDNIVADSPWNTWLVRETGAMMPTVLESLKKRGLLTPQSLELLPIANDNVGELYRPIEEAIVTALKTRTLIPIEGGTHADAASVWHPHLPALRHLVTGADLEDLTGEQGSSWIAAEIREETRRYTVARAAGVRILDSGTILDWLLGKGAEWWSARDDAWLRACCGYLSRIPEATEALQEAPLVRLQDSSQVAVSAGPIFFPPGAEEAFDRHPAWARELPFLRSTLLEGPEGEPASRFLNELGVLEPRLEQIIRSWVLPRYAQDAKPEFEENRHHIRFLVSSLREIPQAARSELVDEIGKLPVLYGYRGVDAVKRGFIAPNGAYLPPYYHGNEYLEAYLAPCDHVWFVTPDYLDDEDDAMAWGETLIELGCAELPRLLPRRLSDAEREALRGGRWPKAQSADEDVTLDGLEVGVSRGWSVDWAVALWRLLVRIQGQDIWQRTYRWDGTGWRKRYWEHEDPYPTTVARQLRSACWVPDAQGEPRKPGTLFAATPQNQNLLGDTVSYVHPEIDLTDRKGNEEDRELARRLELNLSANAKAVLGYLRTLSGSELPLDRITAIYRFLSGNHIVAKDDFRQAALIYTPTPDPRWWRAQDLYWENESATFGAQRGYLCDHYDDTLKGFFLNQDVAPAARPVDYVRAAMELSREDAASEQVQARLRALYRRIEWVLLEEAESQTSESNDAQARRLVNEPLWKDMLAGLYWLGHQGDTWGFFRAGKLFLRDNDHLAALFAGRVPMWPFEELDRLASLLNVRGCSTATSTFNPSPDGELPNLLEPVRALAADLESFLSSPRWREERKDGATTAAVKNLERVRGFSEARQDYRLDGVRVPDSEPQLSRFSPENRILWLSTRVDPGDYPDLIGDALQEFFGAPELREFAKDLLTSPEREKVLRTWKRRGLIVKETSEGSATEESRAAGDQGAEQTGASTGEDRGAGQSGEGQEGSHGGSGAGSGRDGRGSCGQGGVGGSGGTGGSGRTGGSGGGSRGGQGGTEGGGAGGSGAGGNTPQKRRGSFPIRVSLGGDDPAEPVDRTGGTRSSADEAGIGRVQQWEARHKRYALVLAHNHPGYDIESYQTTERTGPILRYIEVKSIGGAWDDPGVALTDEQFRFAQQHGEAYWLYVVENPESDTEYRIHRIKDPARLVTRFFYNESWRAIAEPEVEPVVDATGRRPSELRAASERRQARAQAEGADGEATTENVGSPEELEAPEDVVAER